MRDGRWKDSLPGYRIIAGELGVSWRTSNAALKLLADRGLIDAATKGRPRRVLANNGRASMAQKVMLEVTSSKIAADSDEQALLDDLLKIWFEKGGEVRRAQIDYRQRKKPAAALRRLVAVHGANVLLMREPLKPWVEAALTAPEPVYFLGGDIPRDDFEKVTGFAVSISNMVSQAVTHLRAFGHQRILIPDEGRGPMFRQSVLAAMKQSWGGCPPVDALYCPEFAELEPEAWQRYWEEAFRRTRPTAVIVHKEKSYFSLLGFCLRHRLRIPDDLSVICLAASDALLWCHPVPDHVTFPRARALAHFRRWIRGGFQPLGLAMLPVDLIAAGGVRQI